MLSALVPVAMRVLGPERPDTLLARSYLAYWIGQAGNPAGARDLYAALIPVEERVLGPEHSDVLIGRSQFARFIGEAGDPAGARDATSSSTRCRLRPWSSSARRVAAAHGPELSRLYDVVRHRSLPGLVSERVRGTERS